MAMIIQFTNRGKKVPPTEREARIYLLWDTHFNYKDGAERKKDLVFAQ